MDLKPFLHEHHLVYDKYEKQKACCDNCNLHIEGWALTCEICEFWLHKSCAVQQLPLKISHPLHTDQHPLELVLGETRLSPSHFFCNGCSGLTRDCLYRCRGCDLSLDLICASSTTINSQRQEQIRHFCHLDHPLTGFKYRKVSKYHYTCFWCHKLLSGVSYGCFKLECSSSKESFFHETCLMNMPNIISKHHFHPSHQLQLPIQFLESPFPCFVCGYYIWNVREGYFCSKCQFLIHFRCVQFKPSLKHELHHHRLTLFPVKPDSSSIKLRPCMKCRKKIFWRLDSVFNYYYRCVPCGFNFHLLCLIPSSNIKQKHHRHELVFTDGFHEDYSDQYYCDVCEEERKAGDPVYCCNKCAFVAQIGCALDQVKDDVESTSSLVGDKDSIEELKEEDEMERNANFSVQFEIKYCDEGHGLIFSEALEKNESSDRCSVCYVEISEAAYACKRCSYYIHTTCITWPSEVANHPLHSQHSLKLIPRYEIYKGFGYKCQGCRGVNTGYAYVCYVCDFVLDVKCATSWVPKTETQRLKDIGTQSKLCFFNQDHKLDCSNYVSNSIEVMWCGFCGLYLSGPVYDCRECGYWLHESCVGFPWEMQIQFHPRHLLRPLWIPTNPCSFCNCSFDREISYSCVECDLYLHVHCAKALKRVLKSKSHIHDHDLYYFGSNTLTFFYAMKKVCEECKTEFSSIPFCFCMECHTMFHIEHILPPSFKSKYHLHTLTFKDGFKEDDSGEYYCDICEEERDPTNHVYQCTDCQVPFVAHLSCALNSEEETTSSSNLVLDLCPSGSSSELFEDESDENKDGFTNE